VKQKIILFNRIVLEAIMAKIIRKGKKSKVTPAGKLARKVYKKMVNEYKNKAGVVFQVGDVVALNKDALTWFKTKDDMFAGVPVINSPIYTLLPDVKGTVVLKRQLGGYWTWDVNDLVIVRKASQ
jgi:hypothetical protein